MSKIDQYNKGIDEYNAEVEQQNTKDTKRFVSAVGVFIALSVLICLLLLEVWDLVAKHIDFADGIVLFMLMYEVILFGIISVIGSFWLVYKYYRGKKNPRSIVYVDDQPIGEVRSMGVKEPKSEAKSAALFGGEPHDQLQVLRDRKGFYIGTLYIDEESGEWRPYRRDSAKHWSHDMKAKEALTTGRYEKLVLRTGKS